MEIRVVILTTWQNGEPSIKMTQFWKSSVESCLNFFYNTIETSLCGIAMLFFSVDNLHDQLWMTELHTETITVLSDV